MSEVKFLSPMEFPEDAAQEILLAIVKSGSFVINQPTSEHAGSSAAEALIALHRALTEYYRLLEK